MFSNPDKGVIINKPDGPNVYANVPKDYTENVTYVSLTKTQLFALNYNLNLIHL